MNLFDIAVNSSLGSETSSLAISEALSLKLAVVASDIDGNRALLKWKAEDLSSITTNNALFFKCGDSVSLANSLLFLLENGETRKRIGENGFRLYEKELTVSVMAKKYEELYRELGEKSF